MSDSEIDHKLKTFIFPKLEGSSTDANSELMEVMDETSSMDEANIDGTNIVFDSSYSSNSDSRPFQQCPESPLIVSNDNYRTPPQSPEALSFEKRHRRSYCSQLSAESLKRITKSAKTEAESDPFSFKNAHYAQLSPPKSPYKDKSEAGKDPSKGNPVDFQDYNMNQAVCNYGDNNHNGFNIESISPTTRKFKHRRRLSFSSNSFPAAQVNIHRLSMTPINNNNNNIPNSTNLSARRTLSGYNYNGPLGELDETHEEEDADHDNEANEQYDLQNLPENEYVIESQRSPLMPDLGENNVIRESPSLDSGVTYGEANIAARAHGRPSAYIVTNPEIDLDVINEHQEGDGSH